MTINSVAKTSNKRSLKSYVPILEWLPNYQKDWLGVDIVAALIVWALLVPEAMAYASIAGMPPETGLYAAPLALIAYAIFGTSKQLNVGPAPAVAALSFTVIAGLGVAAGSPEFVLLTIALAFTVGVLLIIAGFLRLGVLADFLSRPVLDGFIVGVAISIVVGQLDKILGFEPEGYNFVPDAIQFSTHLAQTNIATLIIGSVSLALLFAMHKFTPKLPASLVVLFLVVAASTLFNFEALGIPVVGEIPSGLPTFGFPEGLSLQDLLTVIPGTIGVAFVVFAESLAIARSYGTKYGYEVDANQEMIALGAANIGSGFSGSFSIDGSMSRTAASDGAGGKSQMVSLIAAVAVLITAVALTGLFYNLPEATLGAIVIHAVWNNINFKKLRRYRHITNLDFATAVVAMFGVLLFGLLQGLLIATFLGFFVLLIHAKQRTITVLGKKPETAIYRSITTYPDGETYPGLLILRFDSSVFFANAHDFITAVRRDIAATEPAPQVVLIDGESINVIDSTAVFALDEFQEQLTQSGVQLRFARIKPDVMVVMERGGLTKNIPPEHFYLTVQDGVNAFVR